MPRASRRTIADLYASDQAVRLRSDFVGRAQALQELAECVHSRNCVQVIGPRRSGKSSLLLHLTRAGVLGRTREDLVTYVNLQALAQPTEEAFWAHLLGAVRARLTELGAGEGDPTPDAPPLSPAMRGRARTWLAEAPTTGGYLEVLPHVQRLKGVGFSGLTLLLDELEIVGQIPTQHELTQRLRALAADVVCPVTFITAHRLSLPELTESRKVEASPFFNIFSQTVRVGPFDPADWSELLSLPERLAGAGELEGWSPSWSLGPHAAWLDQLSGRQPWLATVLCRRALRRMAETGLPLGEADKRSLASDVREDMKGQIQSLLGDLSEPNRRLLGRIAWERLALPPDGSSEVRALLADGLVRVQGEKVVVASSLIAEQLPRPRILPWNRRRMAAVGALIAAAALTMYLGDLFFGVLPTTSRAMAVAARQSSVVLAYPEEVRVGEVAKIELTVNVPEGEAGALRLSWRSDGGGLAFPGGVIEQVIDVPEGEQLSRQVTVEIEPRQVDPSRYTFDLEVGWRASGAPTSLPYHQTVFIDARPLSSLAIMAQSAAALLLAVLGFLGLSTSSLLTWIGGLLRPSTNKD